MPLIENGKKYGMPLVVAYFNLKESVFLNTAHARAEGLEAVGNFCLGSYHYLFSGKQFTHITKTGAIWHHRFASQDHLALEMLKTLAALVSLPLSLLIGSFLKGLSFISSDAAKHHYEILRSENRAVRQTRESPALTPTERVDRAASRVVRASKEVTSQQKKTLAPLLRNVSDVQKKEIAALPEKMQRDLLALRDLSSLLDAQRISWWVDFGTLLGAYRHEGIIPWDHDIDLSILQKDHETVLQAAKEPDFAKKYRLMDWSPAGQPRTLLKLLVKETGTLMDICHYATSKNARGEETLTYLSPYYDKWYTPHVLKVREEFCRVTQPATAVFPLKTAQFDGIRVYVPNQFEARLRKIYQNELRPCKVWNAQKKEYCNVPGHPYWKLCNE